jgi:NAD-dependent DNA ligase
MPPKKSSSKSAGVAKTVAGKATCAAKSKGIAKVKVEKKAKPSQSKKDLAKGAADDNVVGKGICFVSASFGALKLKRDVAVTAAVMAGATITKQITNKTHIVVHASRMNDAALRKFLPCAPETQFWTEERFQQAVAPQLVAIPR